MKRGGGFTLIELMITITIMVVLMSVAVVNMLSVQANGRDQERQTDIGAIARGLEVYYQSGNPYTSTPKGYYPGSQEVTNAAATTPPFSNFLEGVGTTSYTAPNLTDVTSFGVASATTTGNNPDGSYDDTQARSFLSSKPYLYQPLTRSNTFCTSYANCVKFNLYYLTEVDNTVHVVRSKNQ